MHFLGSLLERTDEVMSPYSISYACHRAVPYRVQAKKVSYRVHSLAALKDTLQVQQSVLLSTKVAFRHFEPVENTKKVLTMKEKIARARASATDKAYPERQQPTCHITLEISEGEGRCTREAEIIYLPQLYKHNDCCKFQLRFFVLKSELL